MPLTTLYEQALLDWVLGGATPTRPTQRWIQFATGSPNTAGASDGPFTPRCTVTFAAANSPQMSARNLNTVSVITATAAGTAVGWNLYDASVGGNRIMFGTCTAAIGCKSGDNISISPSLLRVVLS